MIVTFDSSAWIEYFSGSSLGSIVKEYLVNARTVYTPSIALFEIKHKYLKEKKKWKSRIDFIIDRSIIIDINPTVALLAADIKKELRLHAVDALIYASAKSTKSKLLSKDTDFENLKDVIFLK